MESVRCEKSVAPTGWATHNACDRYSFCTTEPHHQIFVQHSGLLLLTARRVCRVIKRPAYASRVCAHSPVDAATNFPPKTLPFQGQATGLRLTKGNTNV